MGGKKEANNEEGAILYGMVTDLTEKMPMKNRVQRNWRIKGYEHLGKHCFTL